jgi:hypothetical protein
MRLNLYDSDVGMQCSNQNSISYNEWRMQWEYRGKAPSNSSISQTTWDLTIFAVSIGKTWKEPYFSLYEGKKKEKITNTKT